LPQSYSKLSITRKGRREKALTIIREKTLPVGLPLVMLMDDTDCAPKGQQGVKVVAAFLL